jgi:hypothetical protein
VRIALLPDVQCKPGLTYPHLAAYGNYIAAKQPDVIVCIGDFADMPSLSSYDVGKRSFEGRRVEKDYSEVRRAMDVFMEPIAKVKGYKPRLVLTLGNHEERINRAAEDDPKLTGLLSIDKLGYESYGWEVYPFLEVVMVGGVAFSHYFVSGAMGRPITTAAALLTKRFQSCVAGHAQGYDIARRYRADGKALIGVIAGSFYLHNEPYMGAQANHQHWRGALFLNDVRGGQFDEMPLSINYLLRRFR